MSSERSFTASQSRSLLEAEEFGENWSNNLRVAETPSRTDSVYAGDWKDLAGLCFVESVFFGRSATEADLMAVVERAEDQIDGRAATRAFDDSTNATREGWDELRGRLGL